MSEKENACFRAVCPAHDWEGMARENYEEADKDLVGHQELYPDESHDGSRVSPC